MTDAQLLNSIEALAVAGVQCGILPQVFAQLYDETKRIMAERDEATESAAHYQLLYNSVCTQFGADVDLELPPL